MYIVTSSLMKDISSKNDLFRANALRTIPLVLDQSNLVQIERYLLNVNFFTLDFFSPSYCNNKMKNINY